MKGLAPKTHYTLRLSAVIIAIIAASNISAAQIEARQILSRNEAATTAGKGAIIAESTVEEIIHVLSSGGNVPLLS